MRVVLDTNVLVRAVASPTGPAGEAFDLLGEPHLLITSPVLLTELAEVLTYDRVRQQHGRDDTAIQRFLDHIEDAALLVDISAEAAPAVVSADRDDDLVIATAVVGKADAICTLDRHFRDATVQDYCAQHGVRVLTDVELLALLREEQKEPDAS